VRINGVSVSYGCLVYGELVAELFQISTRTVSELTARGVIIAVKLGGGRNAPVRYRRETLEETAKKLERR
jgi:phage terminase Nu1 subunit (DNA packaging protein)